MLSRALLVSQPTSAVSLASKGEPVDVSEIDRTSLPDNDAVLHGVGMRLEQRGLQGAVYVANIIKGGSADRSGLIAVLDVLTQVDAKAIHGECIGQIARMQTI